jgi:hypothetical protein
MAWETEMITIVRYLIYDFATPYTYSDDRLETAISIAAQLLLEEVDFKNDYLVDISIPDIVPDPTDGDKDNAFINLCCLKTACLIDNWSLRSKVGTVGVAVKSGPDSVDTRGAAQAYQYLYENGACKTFEEAKWEFKAGNLTPGRAILAPFVGENVDSFNYSYNPRDRSLGL